MYEAVKEHLRKSDARIDEWKFEFPIDRNTIPSHENRYDVLGSIRGAIARKCPNGKPKEIKFGDDMDSSIDIKSCDPSGLMKAEVDYYELGFRGNGRPWVGTLDIDVREESRKRHFNFSILGRDPRDLGSIDTFPLSIPDDLFGVFNIRMPDRLGRSICIVVDRENIGSGNANRSLCVQGEEVEDLEE